MPSKNPQTVISVYQCQYRYCAAVLEYSLTDCILQVVILETWLFAFAVSDQDGLSWSGDFFQCPPLCQKLVMRLVKRCKDIFAVVLCFVSYCSGRFPSWIFRCDLTEDQVLVGTCILEGIRQERSLPWHVEYRQINKSIVVSVHHGFIQGPCGSYILQLSNWFKIFLFFFILLYVKLLPVEITW